MPSEAKTDAASAPIWPVLTPWNSPKLLLLLTPASEVSVRIDGDRCCPADHARDALAADQVARLDAGGDHCRAAEHDDDLDLLDAGRARVAVPAARDELGDQPAEEGAPGEPGDGEPQPGPPGEPAQPDQQRHQQEQRARGPVVDRQHEDAGRRAAGGEQRAVEDEDHGDQVQGGQPVVDRFAAQEDGGEHSEQQQADHGLRQECKCSRAPPLSAGPVGQAADSGHQGSGCNETPRRCCALARGTGIFVADECTSLAVTTDTVAHRALSSSSLIATCLAAKPAPE